ncbi:MAG: hypothetical protein IH985_05180 [Planctomycetes bacterium]|nr:hypothetical protein [Planctomycetota bacterium]
MTRSARLAFMVGTLAGAASVFAQVSRDAARAESEHFAASARLLTSAIAQDAPSVRVTGQLQFRYVINHRDQTPGAEDDAVGFQTRRSKFKLDGTIADRWKYKVSTAFSRSSGTGSLEDAYVRYIADDGWEFTFGKFKLPYAREESVSSSAQLTADRSVTNAFFSLKRSQAVRAAWEGESARFAVAFSDGSRADKTDFISADEADFALTARGEYRFAGNDWGAFKQFTSFRGSSYAAMAGAAVHYQSGGETFGTADEDFTGLTADLSLLGDGFNAFAAILWQRVEPAGGPALENTGLIVQGGWFVDPAWELFARWDAILSDQVDDFSTVTVGVNRYLLPESHAAKFTGDVQFFLDEQASTDAPASTATGLQASTRDGQWALRLQMQLLF